MMFKQLTINIDSTTADKLSDIFFDLDILSVSIEDQYNDTDLEQVIFGEPGIVVEGLWENSRLVVLVEQHTDIKKLVSKAKSLLGQSFDYTVESINNQDWVSLTQNQFQPIKVSDKLYIVPSWHESPDKEATAITLDPGMAFGTGSHPTTFMCLQWLSKNITPQNSVLDYGCGSGILAITAKKLGADIVYGVDIDKEAIVSSKTNATNNNVAITFTESNKLPAKTFEVVIANILSNPLRLLAPSLAKLTKSKLILSGILDSQAEELSDIYSRWFKNISTTTMDGWVLLECVKS